MPKVCRSQSIIAVLAAVVLLSACNRIDDHRLPAVGVNIIFTTQGMWNTYGVNAALDTREFIHTSTKREPAGFPFTATTYTGYGGVLLAVDFLNEPLAYDLACPVEARPDVRIEVDHEHNDARCPTCGSTYDIFGGFGRPLSGPAAERGYGLTRYRVIRGDALNYMVVTR